MIDQAGFQLNQGALLAMAIMVGFLVFAVALDLTWEQFRRLANAPGATAAGLVTQFLVLPAVAFGVGVLNSATPSVALGLLLVACCPGGPLSNYLTGVARGDVAMSIAMTALSTLACIVATPFLFLFWASRNPDTLAILEDIRIDPGGVAMTLLVMLVIPVTAGMLMRAKRPATVERTRVRIRRSAGLVFAAMVVMVLGSNINALLAYTREALPPVLITFAIAVALAWGLSRTLRIAAPQRRALALEVGLQNVALAITIALTFFPSLSGVVVTAAIWGVVHIVFGFGLAATWARIPPGTAPI